jgi:hypothetical protein
MNVPNLKVYLAVSFALIILLIIILIIPFGKKTTTVQPVPTAFPTPTTFETQPNIPTNTTPGQVIITPAVFTGVKEVTPPQGLVDLSTQKQDLRQKTPLSLTTFTINFDYSKDKFVVTLNEPKDQSQKEFESWKIANYPALGSEQFMIR